MQMHCIYLRHAHACVNEPLPIAATRYQEFIITIVIITPIAIV